MRSTYKSDLPLRLSRPLREAVRERSRELWSCALPQRSVRLRAGKLGLTVGLLQTAINPGDRRFSGQMNLRVVLKSFVSPLISFALVLFSAAHTWGQRTLEQEAL